MSKKEKAKKVRSSNTATNFRKEFYRKNKCNLIIAVTIAMILSIFEVALAFILKDLVDIASGGSKSDLMRLMTVCVAFLAVYVLLAFIARYFRHNFFYNALFNYKNNVFSNVLKRDINAFNDEETSKYISALSNDVNSIEINYLENIINCTGLVTMLVGGFAAMIYLNWKLFLCVLGASLLPISVSVIFGGKLTKCEKNVSNQNESFTACVKDMLSGFSVIKCFKAENVISNEFDRIDKSLEMAKKEKRNAASNIEIFSNVAGILLILVIFTVGAIFAINGLMSIGVIVAFIQLMNYIIRPIQELPVAFSKMSAARALVLKIERTDNIEDNCANIEVRDIGKAIDFEDVHFSYDGENEVLKGIDLKIERGQSYAIVGTSGSGKSTLLNLLLGYHKNYTGKIYVDNTELRDIKNEFLYDIFSIIQQNVYIFNSTIENNVTMFKEFDEANVQKALTISGLDDLIWQKGMEYLCGENGCNLSGGERQRISIARCIVKNLPVIMLDEATSSLDNATAFAVEKSILDIEDATKIIVTHKLDESILRMFDEIVFLKDGRISEQGNFDELMDKQGDFQSLYSISKSI